MAAQSQVIAAIENQALQVATIVEQQIDAQIQTLDNLGDDDLAAIRRSRIAQMKQKASKVHVSSFQI